MATEIVRKVLVLGFKTTNGKTESVTINQPAEGIGAEIVVTAMEEMIAAGCYGKDGLIAEKASAKFVTLQNQSISL